MKSNPYDELYKQVDMRHRPYGYPKDYLLWRTAKLKRRWAEYIRKDGKILDVGGGFGVLTDFLPDLLDRGNYYNLDVSVEMLRYCPYNNILAAGEKIPFRENSFDYVASSDALEHVNSKTEVLTECYRVLKPGGKFFLSTPRVGWREDLRRSPFQVFLMMWLVVLMMSRVVHALHPRRPALVIPNGVRDEPSDEDWLRRTVQDIGFNVLEQFRADNHVPWGQSKFWRRFADRFVDPKKYGHCTVLICAK